MSEHFFKTLKIERFRGIKSLEIRDLERVNVFVGKNNCGKTSVLEAAFLVSDISNPGSLVGMQNIRGIVLGESSDLRDFFYRREHEKGIGLSCTQAEGRRTLAIHPLYGNLQTEQAIGGVSTVSGNGGTKRTSPLNTGTSLEQSLIGIRYEFVVEDGVNDPGPYKATTRWTSPNNREFTASLDDNYRESVPSYILGKLGYNHELVDRMLNAKKKKVLLDSLQSIDRKVEDIKTGSRDLVSVDIGLDRFVPVNLLGDGMMRILNIHSGIEFCTNGTVCIDEMENGLHVTALDRVWEVILDRSEKANVQIFLTTHSGDVIKSLRNVLGRKLFSDSVACYHLAKFEAGDETHAYRYSAEQLGQALNSDTDIRL